MTNSVWRETASMPEFSSLQGSVRTDVLIIGGGIAGILCAHMLAQAGIEYILVEEREICSGITENTTAKITSQHGMVYDQLLYRFGVERTKGYLQANEAAIDLYRKLCREADCDYREQNNFVYSKEEASLQQELEALN